MARIKAVVKKKKIKTLKRKTATSKLVSIKPIVKPIEHIIIAGKIGNFGSLIVFETSDQRILNFSSFQKTVSGNWATHDRIGKKPQSEFLNANLQQITFTITLNAQHGVKPRKTMENIEKAVEKGRVENLVVGGAKVGKNKWKITQMTEAWDIVMNCGEVQKATLNLTLEEYL